MTNHYLSIRNQIPTFHADNVIAGETHKNPFSCPLASKIE
jgi:hypothetical protein